MPSISPTSSGGSKKKDDDAEEASIILGSVFGILGFFLLIAVLFYGFKEYKKRSFASKMTGDLIFADQTRFSEFLP